MKGLTVQSNRYFDQSVVTYALKCGESSAATARGQRECVAPGGPRRTSRTGLGSAETCYDRIREFGSSIVFAEFESRSRRPGDCGDSTASAQDPHQGPILTGDKQIVGELCRVVGAVYGTTMESISPFSPLARSLTLQQESLSIKCQVPRPIIWANAREPRRRKWSPPLASWVEIEYLMEEKGDNRRGSGPSEIPITERMVVEIMVSCVVVDYSQKVDTEYRGSAAPRQLGRGTKAGSRGEVPRAQSGCEVAALSALGDAPSLLPPPPPRSTLIR
ncbi:hypothetical protein EVAR_25187_1 [Eumeta japonica]|uniref:Uncharacterized protein n=1 Tax=Eumeta variegata TaxID=151549 RepID=A0A4C1WHZ4_EUMVA|nr:hypothetical protein EVAR_25187_1 [Eumeta japonica]